MSDTYLISDLHIGHSNIHLKWKTQFKTQEEHTEHAIECWNSVVGARDTVKVLGDFIIGRENLHYLNRFNGIIHWILGNHDPKITKDILVDYRHLAYVGGILAYKGTVLSHAPIHPQELEYRNWALNLHGHIHHKEKNNLGKKYFNCNVDIMGDYPREFHSIIEEVGAKN